MIAGKDEQARRNIYCKCKINKYYSLTKMEDFKNCMLTFWKLQGISRKQEMEKFENQRQERHRKEQK